MPGVTKKTCEGVGSYTSLNHCQGVPVMSGIRSRLYFIPKSDIVKWPTLGALNGENAADAAVYTGDFTLAEVKKWLFIDLTFDEGEPSSEPEGEYPNQLFVNKINVAHPDKDEYATAFARRALNDDLVYLFQERNGKFRVIGNEAFHCQTKPSQKGGAKPTDKSGTYLEISCEDICPAPFYTGKIETEAGDISGADGSAVLPASV